MHTSSNTLEIVTIRFLSDKSNLKTFYKREGESTGVQHAKYIKHNFTNNYRHVYIYNSAIKLLILLSFIVTLI